MEYLKDYGLSPAEQEIIIKASKKFYAMVDGYGKDPYSLLGHLVQLQKRANISLHIYKELDPLVLFLSLRLHDVGLYPINDQDHAIIGEAIARKWLEEE